jgi:hypothetical protein
VLGFNASLPAQRRHAGSPRAVYRIESLVKEPHLLWLQVFVRNPIAAKEQVKDHENAPVVAVDFVLVCAVMPSVDTIGSEEIVERAMAQI